MIYIPSFMKIGKAVAGIFRFCLTSFDACNVGITDGNAL
jgi:hypothetical protein